MKRLLFCLELAKPEMGRNRPAFPASFRIATSVSPIVIIGIISIAIIG